MQIYQQKNVNMYTPSFQSRRADIRALDDLSKIVTREFPMMSNTKVETYKSIHKMKSGYRFYSYLSSLIDEMRGYAKMSKNSNESVFKALDTVKKLKVGNCQESSDIAYTVLRLNGYKNVQGMRVCAYNPETETVRVCHHSVVGVDFTKPLEKQPKDVSLPVYVKDTKGKIVDTWGGFVDTERNAALKYKSDDKYGIDLKEGEQICFVACKAPDVLSKWDLTYLRHKYPELARTKEGLMSKIRWFFMDKTKYEYEPFSMNVRESLRTNNGLKGALTRDELIKLYNPK